METTKKHDWTLIIAGILLILCGGVFAFSPVETLVTIAMFAGAFFLLAGIFDIVNYFRFRKSGLASGWTVFYGILDIVLGLMFLIHPIILAGVIPWLVGIFVAAFGIYECIAAFRVKKTGASLWGWILFSGIVSVLMGILFFAFPATFVIYIAIFLLMRGINLAIFGWNATSVSW